MNDEDVQQRASMARRVQHDFTNHPPVNDAVGATFDEATRRFIELAEWLIDHVPLGRELSLALTQLEQTSMWTKAGIARHQDAVVAPEAPAETQPTPAAPAVSDTQHEILMLLGVAPGRDLPDVSDVNVMNAQLVGTNGENISVQLPAAVMSKDSALVHAAWLALLADSSDARFAAILAKCANT